MLTLLMLLQLVSPQPGVIPLGFPLPGFLEFTLWTQDSMDAVISLGLPFLEVGVALLKLGRWAARPSPDDLQV